MKYALLLVLVFTTTACTFNKKPQPPNRLDGNAVAVLPIKGRYSNYATEQLIASLRSFGYKVVPDSLVRTTARELGIQAEHRIFPEGPSIYAPSSRFAIARRLGVSAFFTGSCDAIDISDKTFSGAYLYVELLKTDTQRVLWSHEYRPGFWTTAITAKGHIKRGMRDLAKAFQEYEEEAQGQ